MGKLKTESKYCNFMLIQRRVNAKIKITTRMLDLLAVGPKFTWPACHIQPTTRIAIHCIALLLQRALLLEQTDRRTDGRTRHSFNTLTYVVRVMMVWAF